MIISKKKFEEAVAKRIDEAIMRLENERYYNQRFGELDERMGRAFNDIDRRLTELEKKSVKADQYAVCSNHY